MTTNYQLPTTDYRLRLGILVSGRGTNLQAILDAIASNDLQAEVALVICNHSDAHAIERAHKANVPVALYTQKEYGTRQTHQRAIAARLIEEKIDLIVCAGWDRIFTHEFVDAFPARIINVHPAILPSFAGGLHAVRDALEYGVKITGCTIHFVTHDLDSGPIISQAPVPVLPDDDEAILADRIRQQEHRLLLEAINLFAQGKLAINGRKVVIKDRVSRIAHHV